MVTGLAAIISTNIFTPTLIVVVYMKEYISGLIMAFNGNINRATARMASKDISVK